MLIGQGSKTRQEDLLSWVYVGFLDSKEVQIRIHRQMRVVEDFFIFFILVMSRFHGNRLLGVNTKGVNGLTPSLLGLSNWVQCSPWIHLVWPYIESHRTLFRLIMSEHPCRYKHHLVDAKQTIVHLDNSSCNRWKFPAIEN